MGALFAGRELLLACREAAHAASEVAWIKLRLSYPDTASIAAAAAAGFKTQRISPMRSSCVFHLSAPPQTARAELPLPISDIQWGQPSHLGLRVEVLHNLILRY